MKKIILGALLLAFTVLSLPASAQSGLHPVSKTPS